MRLLPFAFLVVLSVLSQDVAVAQAPRQVQSTMNLLPQSTNALAIVRFETLLKTPQAAAEQWAQKPERLGMETIPAWISWGIIGKEVDPVRGQLWEIALVPLPAPLSVQDIADQQSISVQEIEGTPVARGVKRDNYYVQLPVEGGAVLGSVTPPSFRLVSQWMSALKYRSNPPTFAPMLTSAAAKPAHVIMAIDLRNVFDPLQAERWVAQTWLETQSGTVPREVASFLGRVEGVSLTLMSTSTLQATLVVQSTEDIKLSGEWIAKIFQKVLSDRHLEIDEMSSLSFQVQGNTATAVFEMQTYSLRQLMSLWLSPHPNAPAQDGTSSALAIAPGGAASGTNSSQRPTASEEDLIFAASQRYFHSVNQMLDDLARASRRATNYLQTATFHDRFAQKISDLPVANVSRELLEYGANIANYLRGLASSLRGMVVNVNAEERTITYQTHFDPGWASANPWGMVGGQMPTWQTTSNTQQVRERQAQFVQEGAAQREQIWGLIDRERARVRIEMTSQFGAEFVEDTPRRRR